MSHAVISGGRIHPELNLSQVEISTAVCRLEDVVEAIVRETISE